MERPGFMHGVYHEMVSVACGARYTMPLGILVGHGGPVFKLYPGAGLGRILVRGVDRLLLIAPRDPRVFWASIEHRLEDELEWPCPKPDPEVGAWYECRPRLLRVEDDGVAWYECSVFKHLAGYPPVYTRSYGCLVELMILYTKARAGVRIDGVRDHARYLEWCVARSSPWNKDLVNLASKIRALIDDLAGLPP